MNTLVAPLRRGPFQVGRPLKYGEPTVKREVRFPESVNDALSKFAQGAGVDVSDVVVNAVRPLVQGRSSPPLAASREDVKNALREVLLELGPQVTTANQMQPKAKPRKGKGEGLEYIQTELVPDEGNGMIPVRLLAAPPCGPWKEALETADVYPLPETLARALGYKTGDFLVRAEGQSMEGAGIPDGALILMRPLRGRKPEAHAVTLVSVETDDGLCLGTVKHWHTTPRGNPDLRDGRGMPYYVPENTKKVEAIAVKVGLIAAG